MQAGPEVLEEWMLGDETWRIVVTQNRGSDTVALQYKDRQRHGWWCQVRPDGTPCLPCTKPAAIAAISIPQRPGWFARRMRGDYYEQMDRAVDGLKGLVAKRYEELQRGRMAFAEYMAWRDSRPSGANCRCQPEPEQREWLVPSDPRYESAVEASRLAAGMTVEEYRRQAERSGGVVLPSPPVVPEPPERACVMPPLETGNPSLRPYRPPRGFWTAENIVETLEKGAGKE